MASNKAPKQWQLTKNETVVTFESWKQNLLYILSLDDKFAPFLADNSTWLKKTAQTQNRGFTDDGEAVREAHRLTAIQKVQRLELMLGQIANFCTVISRNSIVKNSTSLKSIWQLIRLHYGFQSTGGHFLDLAEICIQPDERPEDLYQRIMAFFEDNLMTTDCGVTHHGVAIDTDEDLTPTIENTIVVMWLKLIHPGLPRLVKQKYGSDLRNRSIASIKPEISQALPSLLDELHAIEDTRALRTSLAPNRQSRTRRPNTAIRKKSCILCKTANRNGHDSHYLSECKFLPDSDKRYMTRSRYVGDVEDLSEDMYEQCEIDEQDIPNALMETPSIRRVDVIQSPYLNAYFHQHPVRLTLDTGATTNMMSEQFAKRIAIQVHPASQMACQADGVTPLDVMGEVHCKLTRGVHSFKLDALVVKQLDVDVLAGNPFFVSNDIATRPAKRQIVIKGTDIVQYGQQPNGDATIRRTQAHTLRTPPRQTVLLPGDYVELRTPRDSEPDSEWALEPRYDCPSNSHVNPEQAWPYVQEVKSIDHTIRLTNTTQEPIILKKNEHICQVRLLKDISEVDLDSVPSFPESDRPISKKNDAYSSHISIDPDKRLTAEVSSKFHDLNHKFDNVFKPEISKYNGFSGKIEATVNMGPTLPPQRKGRLPHYSREQLLELQKKFDELESLGVFAKPEEVNVTVEYLNMSFLVKKPNGGHRLVTSFGEVGQYSKPQPSLMPSVDSVLRDIARWKYIIVTDLRQSFYQIPLSHNAMKFCGVVTPFKGIRVYTRSAMGMPGSETCLEELMCRVLGELIEEGCVAKIADDLYIGGDTTSDLLNNWSRVLTALNANNLRLNASKTVICPLTTTILGWVWSNGTLQASKHRITALSSVDPPKTVQGLRSFIGAYKVLSRVIRGYANILDPLDQATSGRSSRDKIEWTDELLSAFKSAQSTLKTNKVITMPHPKDTLWIVTDGSVRERGMAATLYAMRNDKLHLAGFFNAKLKKHQILWLPCEVEALSIATAVKHFSPYIIQSHGTTQVLTDSRPCVQAYAKLNRGEFSNSSRVSTFLSVISRHQVMLNHISGAANLPSDYTSRNLPECTADKCQICKFVNELEESVVRELTVKDVVDGSQKMPFTSRLAWLATQQECPDLRRTHAHLTQGTRPSKKANKIIDVKRYLKDVCIARDGVLIVNSEAPFHPVRERIVVPRLVLDGLLTAIHIRFDHPSQHQTKTLFSRYFFALDVDKAIHRVCTSCHQCMSLKSIPLHLQEQSTCLPPKCVGLKFSLDIMRRYKQYIVVLRETVSSYTLTTIVDNERHDTLRDAIIMLLADMRSLGDNVLLIRVDPAPGLNALRNDKDLRKWNIMLEFGHVKNKNKNPVAEHAIQELGIECLRLSPEGGPLSHVTLALATANLNHRIRNKGLSAREIWTQRVQVTGEQLPIDDMQLIQKQHFDRVQNHAFNAKSKSCGKLPGKGLNVSVGDLVYLIGDKDKTKARERYLVTSIDDNMCQVRKFTKSQFRSKTYQVKLSDCYPICSEVSNYSMPQSPIRGMDDHMKDEDGQDDRDNYYDHECELNSDNFPLQQPPVLNEMIPPSQLSEPPLTDESSCTTTDTGGTTYPLQDSVEDSEAPQLATPNNGLEDNPTRPQRARKKPVWQNSSEWLFD